MSGGHGSMAGTMTEDQMTELEAASGAEFDRLFLEMMTEHHDGAIEMAEAEQVEGRYDEAVALARTIEADQTQEVEEMRRLLSSL